MNQYPYDAIWLQISEESEGHTLGETWCVDKVNDDDKKYVREDWYNSLINSVSLFLQAQYAHSHAQWDENDVVALEVALAAAQEEA